jgi:hypothetical protein
MRNTIAGKEGFILLAGLTIGAALAAGWRLAGWAGVVIAMGVVMVAAAWVIGRYRPG